MAGEQEVSLSGDLSVVIFEVCALIESLMGDKGHKYHARGLSCIHTLCIEVLESPGGNGTDDDQPYIQTLG